MEIWEKEGISMDMRLPIASNTSNWITRSVNTRAKNIGNQLCSMITGNSHVGKLVSEALNGRCTL